MTARSLNRRNAFFLIPAVVLAINGVIFRHSDWPPRSWPGVHLTTNDFGQELLLVAAVLGASALIYYSMERFFRVQVSAILAYVHLGVTLAALLLEMSLDYWINFAVKPTAGEALFGRDLSAGIAVFVFCLAVFVVAQMVFLFNISRAVYGCVRMRSAT